MASPAYALTIADQVFVNALSVLMLPVIRDDADLRDFSAIARDVRPQVNRDHTFVGPLVAAFAEYDGARDNMLRERARLRLLDLLVQFFRWRTALAYDRFAAPNAGAQA